MNTQTSIVRKNTLAEKKNTEKTLTKNTQTSIIKYMDEKYTNFDSLEKYMDEKRRKTWIKNTQTSIVRKNTWRKTQNLLVEKIHGA